MHIAYVCKYYFFVACVYVRICIQMRSLTPSGGSDSEWLHSKCMHTHANMNMHVTIVKERQCRRRRRRRRVFTKIHRKIQCHCYRKVAHALPLTLIACWLLVSFEPSWFVWMFRWLGLKTKTKSTLFPLFMTDFTHTHTKFPTKSVWKNLHNKIA